MLTAQLDWLAAGELHNSGLRGYLTYLRSRCVREFQRRPTVLLREGWNTIPPVVAHRRVYVLGNPSRLGQRLTLDTLKRTLTLDTFTRLPTRRITVNIDSGEVLENLLAG